MKLNILYDIYNILSDEMKKKVLDITMLPCPIGFLKTRQFINENKNFKKVILVKGQKDCDMLANSLKKNFKINIAKQEKDIFEIQLS